jgi:cyclic-di-GMP-binding protein
MAAAESSFDIVSQFDRQELVNAVDQADREIQQRYDLKSSGTQLDLGDEALTITTDSDFTLKQVREVLIGKMARRQLDTRIFDWGKVEPAAKGTVRQVGKLQQGLNQDLAREVVKAVKALPKVRPQIQGDAVRVFGKSRDDLQAAIKLVKDREWPVPLQFTNYR